MTDLSVKIISSQYSSQVSHLVEELLNTKGKCRTGGILLYSFDPLCVLNGALMIQFVLPFWVFQRFAHVAET